MDVTVLKNSLMEYIKKYRFVVVIFLVGLVLMLLPEQEAPETDPLETKEETELDLQDSLADVLSLIQGAGKVRVLLTQEFGEQTLYQTDQNTSSDSIRSATVLVTNSAREETGLIRQIVPPVYKGAIILCQGADNAVVRLSIVDAVKSVTGLTSDRITVLKMK